MHTPIDSGSIVIDIDHIPTASLTRAHGLCDAQRDRAEDDRQHQQHRHNNNYYNNSNHNNDIKTVVQNNNDNNNSIAPNSIMSSSVIDIDLSSPTATATTVELPPLQTGQTRSAAAAPDHALHSNHMITTEKTTPGLTSTNNNSRLIREVPRTAEAKRKQWQQPMVPWATSLRFDSSSSGTSTASTTTTVTAGGSDREGDSRKMMPSGGILPHRWRRGGE